MDKKEIVNSWLAELGGQAGIQSLALNDEGICAIRYNNKINVDVEYPDQSEKVYLNCPMLPVPDDDSERDRVFDEIMRLNFFAMETRGAVFAIDERDESLVLCYGHLVSDLDCVSFMNLLGNFIETADKWYDRLNEEKKTPPAGEAPQAFSPIRDFNRMA